MCCCIGYLIPVLRLQNVKVTDSFARDNATKNVQRSSSGWFLKFQKAESSNPTKYTADYQIISNLPTITSKASSLSEYTYVDTLSKGICYHKDDVVIEFFRDAGCTDKIAAWGEDSGKFTVVYDDVQNSMAIKMTEAGLSEINEATSVYTDSVKRGYSDCAMRITYAATLTADAKMGDTDNPNTVTLTWKRTNTTYFDTLEDCCHVYILVQNKVEICFIRGLIELYRRDSSGIEFGRILSRYFYNRRSVPCCNFKKTTRCAAYPSACWRSHIPQKPCGGRMLSAP